MSTFPANDLVVDVARAADPQRVNAAMQRLSDFANLRTANGAGFDKSFEAAAAATQPAAPKNFSTLATTPKTTPTTTQRAPATASEAAKKFEAFVLQSFLENVLPKEGHGAFGEGAGSGIWRSMMAEQLAAQIAKGGGLGIGKIVERDLANKAALAETAKAKPANGA